MNKLFVATLASSLLLFTGSIARAQTARARIADTPIRGEASLASPIIATLKEGGPVEIVDLQGDWYRVLMPNDQGKPRVGYVLARLIEIVNTDGSLQPIPAPAAGRAVRPVPQAPVPPTAARLAQQREAAEREQALKAEVDALQADLTALQNDQPIRQARNLPLAAADPAPTTRAWAPAPFKRTWLDVNFGTAMSAAKDSVFTFSGFLNDKAAAYGKPPRGAEFDFGGGFMFTPAVGIGLSIFGTARKDVVGLAGAGIGTVGIVSATSAELVRGEGAWNFQAMLVPVNAERIRARVFGGPSFFAYQADMVRDFNLGRSQITGVDAVKIQGTGLGFHIGGDVTFFFNNIVGLGGFARYSRATATIDEPMSEVKQTITLGGFDTGGGLRFRF
jgi:Bacterial SH3 domain